MILYRARLFLVNIQTVPYGSFIIIGAAFDEIAFWYTELESVNPDVEIQRAVEPGMGQFPGARQLLLSTPYTRNGLLWEKYKNRAETPDQPSQPLRTAMFGGISDDAPVALRQQIPPGAHD